MPIKNWGKEKIGKIGGITCSYIVDVLPEGRKPDITDFTVETKKLFCMQKLRTQEQITFLNDDVSYMLNIS